MKTLIVALDNVQICNLAPSLSELGFTPELIIVSNENDVHRCTYANKIVVLDAVDVTAYELAQSIVDLIRRHENAFEYIILPATVLGLEVGPLVAYDIDALYIANVYDVSIADGQLLFKRLIYGGLAEEFIHPKKSPLVVTWKEIPIAEPQVNRAEPLIEKTHVSKPSDSTVRLLGKERIEEKVDLRKARKIVAVGRGLKSREDIGIINELARLLGAELAGSRPIVADYKWLEPGRQVGLSGITVKPELYVAVGISGQIHHIMGMKDSKFVVAINKDANAPIRQYSDVFIKADLYKFIPLLIEKLKSVR